MLANIEGGAGELACKCRGIQIRVPWAVRRVCGQLADGVDRARVDILTRRQAQLVSSVDEEARCSSRGLAGALAV